MAYSIWGFPKFRGTFLGVPIIRIIVYWGLYWGPPIWGTYHIGYPKRHHESLNPMVQGYRGLDRMPSTTWFFTVRGCECDGNLPTHYQARCRKQMGCPQNHGPFWVMEHITAPTIQEHRNRTLILGTTQINPEKAASP